MATITWKGGTGDFNTASFWSNGSVPGAADIAVVDASSGASSITLDGADSVAGLTLDDATASLTLSGALSLNSGVLNLQAGSLTVSGTVSGGTLIPDGGVLTVSGPSAALLGVTVEGTLDLGNSGAAVDVTGLAQPGLTQLDLGANTQIYFLDPEIFDGQTIEMAGGVLASDDLDPNNGSLFFGPGTEIIQNAASTTARIGPDNATLINRGSLNLEGADALGRGQREFLQIRERGRGRRRHFRPGPRAGPEPGPDRRRPDARDRAGVSPVDSVTMAGGVLQGAVQLDTLGEIDVDSDVTLASANGPGPGTVIIDQQPSLFVNEAATSMQILQSATLANAVVLLSGATSATATSAFSHASADIVIEGYHTLTLAPNT